MGELQNSTSDNFAEEESFSSSYPLAIYENYIAGTSESDLNHQVNVVYPDKHTRGFRGTYDSTDNPLWIPELLASSAPVSTVEMPLLRGY